MTAEQQQLLEDLCLRAMEIDPSERAQFLRQNCADHQLRTEAESLLGASEYAQEFFKVSPLFTAVGEVFTAVGEVFTAVGDDGLPESIEEPETGLQIGPYQLLERLGQGGMGVVYRASQQEPVRREVAVKIIRPGMDSGLVAARFAAERQALSLMDHPNIARVVDAGTTGGDRAYFVMELVRGQPITTYCDRARLTVRQRILSTPLSPAIHRSPNSGTSISAYPFGLGFVQTVLRSAVSPFFLSPTIKYIDPNTGIRYIADLIDKGRFLVTKAPDDIGNHDFDCPANPITGVTQTPGDPIPTLCKSFVMSTLEIFAFDSASQTLQIPQPPVFATPNAASFSTAGSVDFMPLLDTTTQGLPCSIRATGTLPPGMAFQNNTLFVQFPGSTIPGSYPFQFVADCETIGLGTQFANYTFGTSMTTQNFTANLVQAPGSSGQASPEGSQARAGSTTPLQFVFPSGPVTLTQGRSTQISLVTNGGTGTTITAGANALPPGMTLTDNGNGTATVGGTPTGAPEAWGNPETMLKFMRLAGAVLFACVLSSSAYGAIAFIDPAMGTVQVGQPFYRQRQRQRPGSGQ